MASPIERLKQARARAEAEARRQAEARRIREATIRQLIKEGRRELRGLIGRIAEAEGFILVVDEIPQLAITEEQLRQVFVRAAKRYGLARSADLPVEEAEEGEAAFPGAPNGQHVRMPE